MMWIGLVMMTPLLVIILMVMFIMFMKFLDDFGEEAMTIVGVVIAVVLFFLGLAVYCKNY